jgi:hypothetical protein
VWSNSCYPTGKDLKHKYVAPLEAAMASTTLPNELLIEIFHRLDIKILANISFCSHRFSELVKPILNSTYVKPIFDDQSNGFIRATFESPYLA